MGARPWSAEKREKVTTREKVHRKVFLPHSFASEGSCWQLGVDNRI